MEKTKHKHGVWAGARALMDHKDFPSLLEASKSRLGSPESNREQTKFQYPWRKWKGDLQALLEKPNLPSSCERMVQVLHYKFNYDMECMMQIALQLARAVIELELRRSESARGVHSPCSDSESRTETALMTRVRSAMKHKEQDVKRCIEVFIQKCYPLVARVQPPAPLQPPAPPPPAPESLNNPHESVSAHMQPDFEDLLEYPLIPDWGITNNNCAQDLQFTPTSNVTLPTEGPNTDAPDSCYEMISGVEQVPGLTPILVQSHPDPLFSVTVLCSQGDIVNAVKYYKSVIEFGLQAPTNQMAQAAGLTPWYYMWLKLGDEVKRRESLAEKCGQRLHPSTKQILCELDPVFAELECDRDYGEFNAAAEATLNKSIAIGNFAAMATKGLLMLGAESDVGGELGVGNEFGDDHEARERKGLQLIVEAMKTDQWTVPRLLVQLIKDRHISVSKATVCAAVEAVEKRADLCSVTSFHLGNLLAYEVAHEVGYEYNVSKAKAALQSCLDGVHVTTEIRLQCMRKLGRLVTFGVGGRGVNLELAERVLKKGVEVDDLFCIQHLANVKLRQEQPEAAAELFESLFAKDEWEVFISANQEHSEPAWETYRIHVLEQFKEHFLYSVRIGACSPTSIQRDRVSNEYGELMLIEYHEYGLKNT